ncbi:MAG TPA: hypothetical protein VGN83_03310 [Falsiroseomonas sp.]|jgi:hypothetical protein|nr:hypothetical protein [Falsiroseomonas sp.]
MDRQVSDVTIPPLGLGGACARPEPGAGVVVFVHGSASGRFSPRNRFVAEALQQAGLGTLLIVGSLDPEVLALNREAAAQLGAEAEVRVVQGASHLFEEAGTLEAVVVHARDWFVPRIGRERGQP